MTAPRPSDVGGNGDQSEDDSNKPGEGRGGTDGISGSAGGGGGDDYGLEKARGATTAASDWLVATRHGRDDAANRAKLSSVKTGAGWEQTYACRRSAMRRGMTTSKKNTADGNVSGNTRVVRGLCARGQKRERERERKRSGVC